MCGEAQHHLPLFGIPGGHMARKGNFLSSKLIAVKFLAVMSWMVALSQ